MDPSSQFRDLLFCRGEPRFYAFDLLWATGRPTVPAADRPQAPAPVSRAGTGVRLLYCDHIEQDGEGLFRLACKHDLEGIVGKVEVCAIPAWISRPRGSRFGTAATANGSGGRNCSSGRGAMIRIFGVGMLAYERVPGHARLLLEGTGKRNNQSGEERRP